MIVTDRADLAALARSYANQGRSTMGAWLEYDRMGYNYRMNEMSAALGVSQLGRIEAILAGERDPKTLVKLRDPRCHKSTLAEMEAGLKGAYDDENLFVLEQSYQGWKFYQQQLTHCDKRIEKVLAVLPTAKAVTREAPPKPVATPSVPKRGRKKQINRGPNAAAVDFSQALKLRPSYAEAESFLQLVKQQHSGGSRA